MKKAAQDLLNELESLKGVLESCVKKEQVSQADYEHITDTLRSALVMAGTLQPSAPATDASAIEDRIIEKLSVVIDSIIDRRMNEYKSSAKAVVDEYRSTGVDETQKKEPKAEKVKEVRDEKPVSETKKAESSDKKNDGKRLYDTIAEKNKPGKSVYDLLSGETAAQEPSGKVPGQKVPDLEKAISLNEKFVFIKELFGGNAQQYSQMVSKLNSMQSMDDAKNFIQSDYAWWDAKDTTVRLFLDLVKRRFL